MLTRFNDINKTLPLLGGNGSVFITLNGKLKNELMDDIPLTKNDDGDLVVETLFLNEPGCYRVIDLVVIHFKFLEHLPFNKLKEVIAYPFDGNKSNTHPGNLGYRFKSGKLELDDHPGFYYVPGFARRAVNINGDLISTLDGKPLKWYIMKPQAFKNIKGGYYTNRVEVSGVARTMLRHRAMLMVFKPYPDNVDNLITNHIDGVPGNDKLDNLEWVDDRTNIIHSYKTNLRGQNKPVVARDVFTGEETVYYSVAECGRVLGISDRSINYKLEKSKFSSVSRFGLQFKYLHDERDWLIPEDPEIAVKQAFQAQRVLVKDLTTGKERSYNSINSTSLHTGIDAHKISEQLKTEIKTAINDFEFYSCD